MTEDTPSVQRVLDLAEPQLRAAAGLTAATVFELHSETACSTPPRRRDRRVIAGEVVRMAGGAAPPVDGTHMGARLRIGGRGFRRSS